MLWGQSTIFRARTFSQIIGFIMARKKVTVAERVLE